MTISIPERPQRPVLRKKAGIWWCSDCSHCGMGPTIPAAYADWAQRGRLIRAMYRSEYEFRRQERDFDSSKDRHGGFYCNHGST
jgi:hypothetical protein